MLVVDLQASINLIQLFDVPYLMHETQVLTLMLLKNWMAWPPIFTMKLD